MLFESGKKKLTPFLVNNLPHLDNAIFHGKQMKDVIQILIKNNITLKLALF